MVIESYKMLHFQYSIMRVVSIQIFVLLKLYYGQMVFNSNFTSKKRNCLIGIWKRGLSDSASNVAKLPPTYFLDGFRNIPVNWIK